MRIIYPSFKIVLRFSTIMALLFSLVAIISKYSLLGGFFIFVLSFFAVFLFSYSFKIKIGNDHIQIFQYFICLDSIDLNDIYDIDCISCARAWQARVLTISTKSGTKTYPIKLYDAEKINSAIASLKIVIKKQKS